VISVIRHIIFHLQITQMTRI